MRARVAALPAEMRLQLAARYQEAAREGRPKSHPEPSALVLAALLQSVTQSWPLRTCQGGVRPRCWHPDPQIPQSVSRPARGHAMSVSSLPPAVALQQAGLVAVRHGARGTQLQRTVWQPCSGGSGDDPAFPGERMSPQ